MDEVSRSISMIFDPRIFFITTLLSQKIIAGTFAFHLYIPGLTFAGFERLYAPIFFEKTDFGFLEIHVPEMMHVKYVLVGYLSMHVLCCLFSFNKNTGPFSSVSTNKETRRTTIPQTRRAHFLLGHFSLWLSLWFLLSTKVRGFLRILRPAKQDMLMPSLSWLEVTCYPGFSKLFSSHKEPSLLKGCKDEEISFSVSVGGA